MAKLTIAIIWKTAHRRAKRIKICDTGPLIQHIWYTIDLELFQVALGVNWHTSNSVKYIYYSPNATHASMDFF